MDQHDGEGETALELPQVREQRRHLGRRVLVDAMEAYEGIEDEEHGPERGDGGLQLLAILGEIEPDARRGDDVDRQIGERHGRGAADPLETGPHHVQGVLRGIEQHGAALRRGEAAQTRHAGRDGDDHVEREKTLAALGLAADDADRFGGPEVLNEPRVLGETHGQLGRAGHRQGGGRHRVRAARARGRSAGAGVKTSKKSCSSSCGRSRSAPARRSSWAWAMSVR